MRLTNLSSVTEFTIRDAREIFELCFPEDCADAWEECVRASISPRVASQCLSAQGIAWAKYYLATSDGSPAGISALYQHVGAPDEIWFGWFGVHPSHQGKGCGKQILEKTVEVARAGNWSTLRLWSTDDGACAKALKMYEAFGFSFEKANHPSNPDIIVGSIGLRGNGVKRWASVAASIGPLFGCEVEQAMSA